MSIKKVRSGDLGGRFRIRRANSTDLRSLGRLGAILVEAHHAFDQRRFLPTVDRTATDYGAFLLRQLDKPSVIVLVAEDAGGAVGYAYATNEGVDYMSLRGPAGVVQDIVVDSASRRRGVGRQLLDAVIAALIDRGASQIILSTAAQNEGAQELFSRAGFRRTMVEMTLDVSRE